MTNPQNVVVRIEIGGQAGGVQVVRAAARARGVPEDESSPVVIEEPPDPVSGDALPALVRVEGPALASHFICATGMAQKSGHPAAHVVGRVYPGLTHSVSEQELADVRVFIEKRLADAAAPPAPAGPPAPGGPVSR